MRRRRSSRSPEPGRGGCPARACSERPCWPRRSCPLSTAYSVAEVLMMIPGLPLLPVLFLSQVVNAVLLVPLLVSALRVAGDRELMGEYTSSRLVTTLGWVTATAVGGCVVALAAASLVR